MLSSWTPSTPFTPNSYSSDTYVTLAHGSVWRGRERTGIWVHFIHCMQGMTNRVAKSGLVNSWVFGGGAQWRQGFAGEREISAGHNAIESTFKRSHSLQENRSLWSGDHLQFWVIPSSHLEVGNPNANPANLNFYLQQDPLHTSTECADTQKDGYFPITRTDTVSTLLSYSKYRKSLALFSLKHNFQHTSICK